MARENVRKKLLHAIINTVAGKTLEKCGGFASRYIHR